MTNENIFKGFLGQEFILWLYWRSSNDGFFDLKDFGMKGVELSLEDQISLESIRGDGFAETISSRDITEQDDIKNSIRVGRVPNSVKVRIIRGSLEWYFQLKAVPLAIKALKLPLVAEKNDDEVIHLRLMLMEELDSIVRALFGLFLEERVNDDFISGVKEQLGI